MNTHRTIEAPRFITLISIVLMLVFTLAAHADEPTTTLEPVTLTSSSGELRFAIDGFYDSLFLAVGAPDGTVTYREIEGADGISFLAVDDEGTLRPDGTYSWELKGIASGGKVENLLGSGFASMHGGAFVSSDLPETGLTKDQQFIDDLIVTGSTCLGEDCSDGETFDLVTLKIKENNTRLLFHDTSNTATFPTRDWMLVANDTAADGGEYFAIVDCDGSSTNCEEDDAATTPFTIAGGAPDNALVLDAEGDLGLGTSVPAADIHAVSGNSPTLRLEQDGSNGFNTQTWDISGNEANFFIRDISNGGNLPLQIKPGAPTASLYVKGNGNVGIGDSSPSAKLDVAGDIALSGTVDGRDLAADGGTLDAHVADFDNPHQVTAAQTGAIDQATLDAHTGNTDNPHQVTAEQVGAVDQATLDAHTSDTDNPHQVTAEQVGAVDQATLDAHTGNTDNPHQVTAEQVGAASQATLDAHTSNTDNPHQVTAEQVGAASQATLDAHTGNTDNPHQVTAEQVGAASQATLDAHTGNTDNPHQVTAAQTGADLAGSAAAALAAHEAAYDHSHLVSALPVPVVEGGTGATDAATARANLGIEDDPTRTGIVAAGTFSGSPATATVTFSSPYPAGTSYVVLLTAFGQSSVPAPAARLIAKSESGFTVALDGDASALVELDWLARPVTEVATPLGVGCVLGTDNVWNDGFVLDNITVTNPGSTAVTSWTVTLTFAEPTTIVNSWNADLTLSAGGTVLEASSQVQNGNLAGGATTTFGFQGTHDGSFDLPTCNGN